VTGVTVWQNVFKFLGYRELVFKGALVWNQRVSCVSDTGESSEVTYVNAYITSMLMVINR